jgi:hypothetical protein
LRACHEIATGKDERNGLLLNGRRFSVAKIGDRLDERCDQSELCKN